MSIRELAKEAFNALETKKRNSGEEFQSFRSGSPEWMKNLARSAHNDGSILPDDYRYEFISDTLDALLNYDDVDEARDSIEADIYTNGLTAWLHSRNDRMYYIDQAISEYGKGESLDRDLMMGQLYEKHEVFYQVLEFLEHLDKEEESA